MVSLKDSIGKAMGNAYKSMGGKGLPVIRPKKRKLIMDVFAKQGMKPMKSKRMLVK